MSSAASTNDLGLMTCPSEALYLATRDERQRKLQRAFEQVELNTSTTVIAISTNVPGSPKHLLGLSRHAREALATLRPWPGFQALHAGPDALGPFFVVLCDLSPQEAKRRAVAIEEETPSARLLDLDIYTSHGTQIGRAEMGLPPRPCLLCGDPAGECMRLLRHSQAELRARAEKLVTAVLVPQPQDLAKPLVLGARMELQLTPKPGLVDRRDQGSHPDLSYESMQASIDLLPHYFETLLQGIQESHSLNRCVQHGIDAGNRMYTKIQANGHRGYIFLAGLLLLAAAKADGKVAGLRRAIAELAVEFFSAFEPRDTPGASIRKRDGLGGIRTEAERGLPAIFEYGWPAYQSALDAGWSQEDAGFYLMAVLMQHVEDTTAIRRCGPEGLTRLRQDGAHLQRLMERRENPHPLLQTLNEDYCRLGLTMGGVADCMALTFALETHSR